MKIAIDAIYYLGYDDANRDYAIEKRRTELVRKPWALAMRTTLSGIIRLKTQGPAQEKLGVSDC